MTIVTEAKSFTSNETFEWFKEKICFHSSQSKKLHRYRHYERVPDLLADVIDTELDILEKFGLPDASDFMNILDVFSWRKKITDVDIKELFETMKQTAESYLLSPAKTDKQILEEGKEAHSTAHDILPLLKADRHTYNIFLYETLFYANDYDADEILLEMKKANDFTAEITIKMNKNQLFYGCINEEIQTFGLKFWNEFVEHKKNEKKTPNRKTIRQFDDIRYCRFGYFPQKLTFEDCYLGSIKYLDAQTPYVMAEIFASPELNQNSIHVYMPFEQMICMLKKANNVSVSSMVRCMLFINLRKNRECTNEIEIRNCYRTYLYCKGIDLRVTQCNFNVSPFEEIGNAYYAVNGFNFPD